MESSRKAAFAGEEPPSNVNLMVSRAQAAKLLQVSIGTIDRLKREERMPQPNRIGRAVRWNRAELLAWVDAGCPDCNEWSYDAGHSNFAQVGGGKTDRLVELPRARQTKKSKALRPRSKKRQETEDTSSGRKSRFEQFIRTIGLDYEKLPSFTNGKIRELAEVDIPTLHKWQYKSGELPEAAIELLKVKLLSEFPIEKYGSE
jgi:excisionase family DNA binding protein